MLAVAGRRRRLAASAGTRTSRSWPAWSSPALRAALDHAALGRRAAPGPPAVAARTSTSAGQRHPDAAGALIISPTPVRHLRRPRRHRGGLPRRGQAADRRRGLGAHLPFHDDLPTWAMDAGADVCVVSVHKMGAGFEQGSVFHVQGDLVDPPHLSAVRRPAHDDQPERPDLRGDGRLAPADGRSTARELLGAALRPGARTLRDEHRRDRRPARARRRAARRGGVARPRPAADPDRRLSELGISGYQAADWLREHMRSTSGMCDHRRHRGHHLVADDETTSERLLDALRALAQARRGAATAAADRPAAPTEIWRWNVLLPRDAFFGPTSRPYPRGRRRPGLRRADHAVPARHPGGGARRADHAP